MEANASILFLFVITLILTSCVFGPPFPRAKGAEYLKSTGASEEIIYKITNLKNMDNVDFEKYAQSDNTNVRHLIACNPNTPKKLINMLGKDKNDFVRQGVALNTSIDKSIAEALKEDPSYSVVSALVGNRAVPEDIILNIYKTNKKISLASYANNPKCPPLIKDDILKSDNDLAKFSLKKTEERIAAEQLEQNK